MKPPYELLQWAPSRLLTAIATGAAVAGAAQAQQTPAAAPTQAEQPAAQTPGTLKPVIIRDRREPLREETYKPGVTSIGRTNALPKDIPQTLTIMNEELLLDQSADSLKDALRNVAGLTFNAPEGGTPPGDNINMRGFSARGDFYLDGMRDSAQYIRDVFNDDRIEVLKGSASMYFGRGSTSGVVNQVSKQAKLIDEGRITFKVGEHDYKRLSADVNQVVGENAAVRVNAMIHDADSFREGVTSKRYGFAPTFRWGIGTRDEFSLSYYHLNYDTTPDLGFRFLNGQPVDEASDRFFGFKSDYTKDSADIFTGTYIHRWNATTNLKSVVRLGDYRRDLWATTAGFATGTTSVSDSNVVTRGNQTRGGKDRHIFNQNDFTTQQTWFGMKHALQAGVDIGREDTESWNYTGAPAKPATTFGNPYNGESVNDTRVRAPGNEFSADTVGMYVQDTLSITDQWKIIGGARWDYFRGKYDRPTADDYSRTDRLWSYRGGLQYQPTDNSSYYVSIGTSYNTAGDLYQYDAASANTPPEKSRNLELGGKWDLFNGDLSLSAALFRTEKYNERNTDPDTATPSTYLLSGKRHADGIELQASGRITPSWEVFFAYTLIKAEIDESTTPGKVGERPGNTPIYAGNIWTTYKLTPKWKIGGGVERMSQRTPPEAVSLSTGITSALSPNQAPAYTRYDAMVEYAEQSYSLKLNLINLSDEIYWDSLYRGFAVPGQRRTAQLTMEYKF